MKPRWKHVFAGVLMASIAAAEEKAVKKADADPESKPTTWHADVAPIFKKLCVGCHGGTRTAGKKPKGDLNLETLDLALKGGEEGDDIVPGKPDESLLYLLITGKEKPVMPPRNKGKITSEEIAVIRAWIEGGCTPGEVPVNAVPYSRPLEAPVYSRAPAVRALAYSRDGAMIYVAGFREILAYRVGLEGASFPAARFVGESEQINALELSPDGGLLAAVGGNAARFGELQLWDVKRGQLARHIRIGQDTLYAIAFSPKGDYIAVAGTDRAIHVFETASGKEVYVSEIHADWIFGLAYSDDGSKIASGSRDKTVKVSTAVDGKLIKNLADLKGHVLRVVARPGTNHVIAAGEARIPVLFDLAEMKELRKFETQPGVILASAFSADGKLLAVGGASGEVRVYVVEDGKKKASFAVPGRWIYTIALSPGGQDIAVAGHNGRVYIFDIETAKEVYSFVSVPIGRLMRF